MKCRVCGREIGDEEQFCKYCGSEQKRKRKRLTWGERKRKNEAETKEFIAKAFLQAEEVKEAFKLEFWAERVETLADKIFSLSNAPMSLVAEYQKFLVEFIISNDVPVSFPLREYADDIQAYTYACLIHKKCAVCGRRADLHHLDAIGMGGNRDEATHLGREVMSLCREHHTEIHTIGRTEFMKKYHLDGGIEADRTVLRIYGLKK